MTDNLITSIIDKHLRSWMEKELNVLPVAIEPEMAKSGEPMNAAGWHKWYPVESSVSDDEISAVESQLKFNLPRSYKTLLKHTHFYELIIDEARFSGQEIRKWKKHLVDRAFNGYPRELLIDKGYIPFADWSDWGLLCFDTSISVVDNEYPVVLWDHERWDQFDLFSDNFQSLLVKLDQLSEKNGN